MDSETPNIAPEMIADAIDAPALAAAAMAANAQVQLALQAAALVPGQDGQLVLPEGVSLNDIRVAGRDLIVKLPDGSEVVIPDGAVFVPQFVIDGIAVPPLNIAALLIGQEPAPAAGRPTSSGGNFADPVGDIGDPFARGDLLPPTQLAFPEPEEREIIPNLVDRDPDVNIQDGGPAGKDVIDNVSEVGLPGTRTNGNVESPGSSTGNGSDSTTGTIIITSPDGIGSITINGIVYTGAAGQQITTPNGVLTLGALTDGQIPYTYRLTDNTSGDSTTDVFTVVVTDPDGDSSTARLTIAIADDVPTARNDTDSVAGGTYGPETGNVLSGSGTTSGSAGADTLGADGGTITGIRAGTSGSFGAVGTTINGQYGTLTLGANGTYSYVRNVNTPGGVNDVFSYQLTDGDGDSSTATLTINIGDAPNRIVFVPEIGDGTQVREPHLPVRDGEPSGSQFDGNPESTSGTITFNSPDGVGSVTVAGVTITPGALPQQVVSDSTGALVITAYNYDPVTGNGSITYTYTLNDNTLNTAGSTVTFPIVVTDLDGDVASDDLNINIIDDAPLAVNDSAAQESENAPVTVNVFSNDTPGADAVNLSTGVAVVAESLSGAGSLVYNGDGTFTYTPAPGEEGDVTFQYTITDGDGDPSTATVTITLLKDSEPRVDVSGENFADEAGLPARDGEPAGSNEAADSETTGGTIAISTGGDTLQSLVINGVNVTAGGTVAGAHGTLTVTVSAGAYSYSYTLTDNTSGEGTTDGFNVVVTDSDGDSANDTLVIGIHDDVPTAIKDADSIAAGEYGPATGNVITDAEGDGGADTPGADGVTVTAISGFGGAGVVDGTTNGQYGVLTLNADGSYSYARNPGTPGGVSDVFSYTITDGDGDPSTATLTIEIGDSKTTLDLPTEGEAGTQVQEAGLPAGSDAAADSELTAGTIAYTAPDGPATVTIDGVAVTAVGQTFTGSFGTLTITSIAAGAIGYEYELTTNTSGDATFDDFAVVVTDQDGDNTPGTLVIDIVDDVPTARADADSVKEDGPTVADGNVISGANVADANATDGVADTRGADGASVTGVVFGAVAGPVAGNVGGDVAGTYGTLVIESDGTYTYKLNNEDPRIQGLDGDDSLTETFTYTITDGDGDPSTTTIEIRIDGSDDRITINGLNVEGPDLIVDEDDLPVRGLEPAGSDTTPDSLTQTGSFTVNGLDGIASIKIEGTETFVGQFFATAYGTFTIASISAPVDGNATAITIGYSYVLTDNTAHANAGGQNFLTELFDVAVTDTDGSTDTDQVEVRIVDDVPTANPDGTYSVAEQTALTFDALANDVKGADGVDLSTGVVVATGPAKGSVVYNSDGTFTYTPNAGAEGADSFTYTITDSDGDTSTTTVTLDLLKDSIPNILRISNLTVDEDGLLNANVDAAPLQASPSETDSTESATASGTAVVNFGADVPTNLLASIKLVDTGALDGQLKTLDGVDVVFALESGALVGRSGGTEVIRIEVSGAVLGPNPGDVTYSYSTTLSQPVKHVASGSEDSVALNGVTFEVTDSETDTATGSFNVTVVDDVPSLDVTKGEDAGVSLVTQDAETDGVPTAEDVATSAANFGGVFGLTSTAGADGAVAPSLAYTLNTAGGASGLTSHGVAINLFKIGNVIVGSTSATAPASATAASVVFSVAVSGTGVVTLTQYSQIDHALPGEANGPYDDQFATLLDSAITLTASSTITDGDGDTASDSETVNIGANISFADDGPVLTNASGNSSVTLDETTAGSPAGFGVAGISQTSAAAIVTATAAFGADGAAAANATTYALSIVGGGVTTLQTAIGNHAISLSLSPDGKTVTGSYNDGTVKTAFTATVNANGTLTVTQFVPLEHLVDGGPGAAHDDALTLSGLINATITITDYDGDTDSETVAIGDRITFKDDGPTLNVTVGSDANAVLITQDADTIGANSDTSSSSGNFGGVFGLTSNGGADGAAAPSLAFALNVANGVSGLTSNGAAINLYKIGNVVVGSTSGTAPASATDASVVFAVSVDGAGVVTLTQYQQIDHPAASDPSGTAAPFDDHVAVLANGKITLTASSTITDNDGDTASDSETIDLGGNIAFADHGPDITLTLTGTQIRIDETDGVVATGGEVDPAGGNLGSVTMTAASLFTLTNAVTSADAPTSYAYNFVLPSEGANSGLLLSTTNAAILLYTAAPGVIEGRVGGIGGAVAFTVSVNPTSGAVTVTQNLAVEHPTGGASHDEDSSPLTAGALTLRVTATDFDGDTDTANVDLGSIIRFEDDGPTALVATTSGTVDEDGLPGGIPGGTDDVPGQALVANGSVTGLFSAGADAPLTYALSTNTSGLPALTSGGIPLSYTVVGNVLTAKAGAATVFTLSLDATTGGWTFTLSAKLDHPSGADENDIVLQFGGLVIATDQDGDTATAIGNLTVTVDDDTPVAAIAIGNVSITHDETQGVTAGSNDVAGPLARFAGVTNVGDDLDVAGSTPLGYAVGTGNFNTAGAAPGADGWIVTYGLIISSQGVDSGVDTTAGESIFLFAENGLIVGRVGGESGVAAFAVGIDAVTSQISLVQYLSLRHPDGTNANDNISLTPSVISAVEYVVDGDGDAVSASVNIGNVITFRDDGPLAQANTNNAVEGEVVVGNVLGNDFFGTDGPTTTTPAGGVVGVRALAGDFTTPVTTGAGTQITGLYGKLTLNADGSYSYDGDPNVITTAQSDVFVYTIRDGDGDLSTTTLTINLTPVTLVADNDTIAVNEAGLDTVNDAGPDTVAGIVNGSNPTSDSDVAQGTLSVAGATNYVLTSANGGSYGTLVLNSNGAYTYTLTKPFDTTPDSNNGTNTETGKDVFNYTATDANGNSVNGTITVDIIDDVPLIDIAASGATLILDESLGTAGSIQNEGGRVNNDETLAGAAVGAIGYATGSIVSLATANAGADGEASRVYSLAVNNTTSGLLDSVTNSGIVLVSVNATTVEGRVGSAAGAVSFRITVDPANGTATINQFRAVEHNDSSNHDENGGSEALMNSGVLSLGVALTDGDGDRATDTVDISQLFKFEDDGPAATGENGTTNEILQDFNTAFVIDFSGSIDNAELNTQLVAVKAAISELFGSTGGNVSVKFVLFATSAMASATFTSAAAANAYLDTVNPATGGTRPGAIGTSTDFSDAITTLLANYAADETANNQVFFLSDGNPNQNTGSGGEALNDTIRPLWNSFVNNNDINVTAIGVGGGINNSNLQQIDVDGAGSPILVANFDDLIDTLTALFAPTPITGDLDINDDYGTDGGRILSITVPTAAAVDPVYTWNGVTGAGSQITVSGGGATINGFTSILVGTEAGGQFVIDFATGAWSYTPPRTVAADTTEVFSYTIVDGDGDTATATLSVLVENNELPGTAPVTATVDDDALSGNAGGTGDLDANVGETAPANPSEAIYNGTLNITATDNPIAAISFAQLQGTTSVIGQETVTYSWNAVTNLLTAAISVSPVANRVGDTLFTVQLNNPSNGSYTVTLVDNVLHSNVAGENDASVALTYRVADTDGSTNTGVLNITFDDDTPVIGSVTSPLSIANSGTVSNTGQFVIASGADGAPASNDTITNVIFSGTVNGSAVSGATISPVSENATTAVYNFSFSYPTGLGTNATANGVLTFNKAAGTYTVDLDNPIQGFSISQTATGTSFTGYALDTSTVDGSQPDVSVSQIAPNLFVQFTGIDGASSTVNYPLVSPPTGNGTASSFVNGELFDTVNDSWVSVSNLAAGVGGDTIGGNEILNFNLYTSNPTGIVGVPTGRAQSMFLKFDGIGASEDFIVIVKLFNSTTGAYTTKALMVQNGDIQKGPGAGPGIFSGVTLDNNDGLIIIESNDYNAAGENWAIVGAQIVVDPLSVTGTAINFNNTTGAGGASTGTQSFATDTNTGAPMKIASIGFLTNTTTAQSAQLTFNVTVQDADGDTASQTLLVNVGGTPPVVLDLDGDGVEFLSTAAGVAFDFNGDGTRESTAWVGKDDGLLALDANGNGGIDNANEIVFGGSGQTDLEGLAANYDSNKDGVLDASDTDFAKFGVWQDANSNGVTDAGEFQSLSDAGITSVKLVSDGVVYSAAGGDVTVHGTSSYTKADGSTGLVADASFAIGAAQTQQREQVQANTLVAASLVALAGADILLQDAAAGVAREGLVSRELDVDTVSQAANQPYQADGIEQPALSAQDLLKVETVELVQQDDMPTTQLWDVNRFDQQERFDIDQADFNQAAPEPIVHDALSMLSMPVEIGSMEALLIANTASDGAVEVQTAALQEVIADTLNDNGIDHLLDQLTGPADGPLLGANDAFGGSEDFAAALIDMPVNADSFAHFSSITVSDQLQEMAASHA